MVLDLESLDATASEPLTTRDYCATAYLGRLTTKAMMVSSAAPIRERLLTSAECLKIAERKMEEAIGDRRHGKELRATAQAWLVLAERIAQAEAIEALKAKGK